MLPDRRAPFAGWERANSIVVNPHKWLFTPLDASLLLTRRMDGPARGVQPRARVPADARPRDAGPRLQRVHAAARPALPGAQAVDPAALVRPRGAARADRARTSSWRPTFAALGRRGPGLGAAGARPVLDGLLPLATGRAATWVGRGPRRRATPRSWTRSTGPARSSCRTPGSTAGSRSASRSATCAPSARHVERAWALLREAAAVTARHEARAARRPVLRDARRSCATGSTPTPRPPTSCGSATTGRRRAGRAWPGRDAVDEALCVGWIDSVRYTPRRRASSAAVHAAAQGQQLERDQRRQGRGADGAGPDAPGRASRRSRQRTGGEDRRSTRTSAPVEALDRRRGGALPGRCRRLGRLGAPAAVVSPARCTHWVTSAKQAATRARRLDDADRGLRRGAPGRADALGRADR